MDVEELDLDEILDEEEDEDQGDERDDSRSDNLDIEQSPKRGDRKTKDKEDSEFVVEVKEDRVRDARPWRKDPADLLKSDDEDKNYGKSVQKRVGKFRAALSEATRQRDAHAAELAEVTRIATATRQELLKAQQALAHRTGSAIESDLVTAQTISDLAESKYQNALLSGDAAAVTKAQVEMNDARIRLSQVRSRKESFTTQVEVNKQQAAANQQQQQAASANQQQSETPPLQREWLGKNPWFKFGGEDPMSKLAIAAHYALIERGYQPNTKKYFSAIDKALRKKFPNAFDDSDEDFDLEEEEKPRRRAVAPPTRRVAENQRTKIIHGNRLVFNKSQLATAKKLGFDTKNNRHMLAYAKQLEEAN